MIEYRLNLKKNALLRKHILKQTTLDCHLNIFHCHWIHAWLLSYSWIYLCGLSIWRCYKFTTAILYLRLIRNNSRSIDRLLVRSLALPNQVRAYLKTSRTMWQLAECISKTTGIIKAQKKHTREKKNTWKLEPKWKYKAETIHCELWVSESTKNLVKYACNTKHKMMQRNRDRDEMKWTSPNVGDDKCNLHLNRRTN